MNGDVELYVITDPVDRVRCVCGHATLIVTAATYHGGAVEWTAPCCGTRLAYIPDEDT